MKFQTSSLTRFFLDSASRRESMWDKSGWAVQLSSRSKILKGMSFLLQYALTEGRKFSINHFSNKAAFIQAFLLAVQITGSFVTSFIPLNACGFKLVWMKKGFNLWFPLALPPKRIVLLDFWSFNPAVWRDFFLIVRVFQAFHPMASKFVIS